MPAAREPCSSAADCGSVASRSPSQLRAKDKEYAPIVTRAIEAFRHREVRVVDGFPFRAHAATGRAAVLRARRASRRIDIVDLAMIRVGIKLRPRQLLDRGRADVA